MALSIQYPFTDTAVSGSPVVNYLMSTLNIPVDFGVRSDSDGECIITNLTCSTDAPERFRFAASEVKDVYAGSGIDPSLYTPSRRGNSVIVQLNEVLNIVDSADATFKQALPMTCHLVFKIPNHSLITSTVVKAFIGRMLDGLFNVGVVTPERIASLLRGGLRPNGL